MRYKQGSRDPTAFITFLREKKLKPGIILRYVGNRLNVLFHVAATVYTLRDILLVFFGKKSTHKGDPVKAIKEHLENNSMVIQLQAMGLCAKFKTGPWMRDFYKNSQNLSNLEIVSKDLLKRCLDNLKRS